MSTRSGKRIHSSFHEEPLKTEVEHAAQSERKTRSRRAKDNGEELCASVVKTKKRTNYVAYPTDDEMGSETVESKDEQAMPARSLRKNALKELNVVTSEVKLLEPETEASKPSRMTRRTRKLDEDTENTQNKHEEEEVTIDKTKKNKKVKPTQLHEEEPKLSKKKTKKKMKKGKRSGSMVVEDIEPQEKVNAGLNKSNISTDSFHSAAGSPLKSTGEDLTDVEPQEIVSVITNSYDVEHSVEIPSKVHEARQTRSTRSAAKMNTAPASLNTPNTATKSRKRKSSANLEKSITNDQEDLTEFDTTLTSVSKKRKSSIRNDNDKNNDDTLDNKTINSTFDIKDLEKNHSGVKSALANTTYDKTELKLDTTYDKNETNENNSTFDKKISEFTTSMAKKQTPPSKLNSTYEKEKNISQIDVTTTENVTDKPALNSTFDKNSSIEAQTCKSDIINTTYEKGSGVTDSTTVPTYRKSSSVINLTYDKDNISSNSVTEIKDTNKSFRKSLLQPEKQSPVLNSTYDKNEKSNSTFEKDKKLDATFDKISKSSLISSDNSNPRDSNITLDKSDISRISITSDESKDNIANTTPVLIESSMDESKIDTSKICPKNPSLVTVDISKTPTKPVTPKISPRTPTPVTPLKREGTFTKDGSDLEGSLQKKLPKTPTRKMSLPSPGCTPFPGNKSGMKIMNVTRSIEKSRRSSLAEPLPRATRVMFCSPVNNPAVVMQQRRKVIKSNLKGSNKSFVFEETAGEVRAAPRKRSYTQSDAEDARAKRARVETARPVRVRTASAGHAAKPEPALKPSTPHKADGRISRTRLPNFAALHQKEFSKMESLDECQERRARRARQLLTPTGAVTVLERSSPRESPVEAEKKRSPNPPDTEPTHSKGKKPKGKDPQPSKKSTHSSKKDKDPQQSSTKDKETKKPNTPVKSLPTLKSLNPGYTRFGFKLNYDVNPFSIPTNPNASAVFSNKKNTIKKDNTKPLKDIKALKRLTVTSALPSLAGVVGTSRREVAKQTVMREKSFTEKRSLIRNENRTVIKGVRTNRRFELQMRMRNID